MKILIVEDTEDVREILRTLLELDKHLVLEAANGRDAVNMAENWNPDLILMDLRMPIMDGYEATRLIRSQAAGKRVPIVAVSADCEGGWSNEALEAGCDTCLAKPYTLLQLRRVLQMFERAA